MDVKASLNLMIIEIIDEEYVAIKEKEDCLNCMMVYHWAIFKRTLKAACLTIYSKIVL